MMEGVVAEGLEQLWPGSVADALGHLGSVGDALAGLGRSLDGGASPAPLFPRPSCNNTCMFLSVDSHSVARTVTCCASRSPACLP